MYLKDHFIAVIVPFPWDRPLSTPLSIPHGWSSPTVTDDRAYHEHLRGKYHARFLLCMHPAVLPGGAHCISCVPPSSITGRIAEVDVTIAHFELRAMPGGVGMLTFLVRVSSPTPTLAQLAGIAGPLREPSTRVGMGTDDARSLLDHGAAVLRAFGLGTTDLLAYGPQFKVFINAVLDDPTLDNEAWDERLFELATGLPEDGMHGAFAPTTSYMHERKAADGISHFRNWRALALFDTFTRLALDDDDPHRTWERDYLVIFQYVHLLRAQALEAAARTAATAANDTRLLDHRDQWNAIQDQCDLAFIAYKWLPNELFQRMLDGGAVRHEIERTDTYVARSVQRFLERRTRNLQRAGMLMAAVAIVLLALLFTRSA